MKQNLPLFILLFIFEFFTQIYSQIQYPIYQKLDNQVILEEYQGTNPSYWLLLVKNETSTVLKRMRYSRKLKKTLLQQFSFQKRPFVLKAYDRRTFQYLLVAFNNQTKFQVYGTLYAEFNEYYDINTPIYYAQQFPNWIFFQYQIIPKFMPQKGNISRLVLSSLGKNLLINQKIIFKGEMQYQNKGWKYVIAIDPEFQTFISQNGIYRTNGISYQKMLNFQISQEFICKIQMFREKIQRNFTQVTLSLKFIAFCYKKFQNKNITGYDWLLISYYINGQYENGTLIDSMTGQTTQIPKFETTQHIQKFIITGQYLNKTPMFILKTIDYIDLIFLDVQVPSIIKDHEMDIQINDWHIFAGNLTFYKSKYTCLFYLIMNQQFILINQLYINPLKFPNLVSTFIVYRPSDLDSQKQQRKQPTLLIYYKNKTTYSYTMHQFESLINIEKQLNQLQDYEFLNKKKYPNLQMSSLKKNIYQTKWVYSLNSIPENKTTFILESYFLNISVNLSIPGIYSIFNISNGDQTCILAENNNWGRNVLVSIVFNPIQKKLELLEQYFYSDWDQYVNNLYSAILIDKCQAIILNYKMMGRRNKNSTGPPIYKQHLYGIGYRRLTDYLTFDQKLNFAISTFQQQRNQPIIFHYNGDQEKYDRIQIKKGVLYPNNIIKADVTQTKLIIFSFKQYVFWSNQDKINYSIKMVVLQKIQGLWTLIYQGPDKTISTMNNLQIKLSPNFQILAVQYHLIGLQVFKIDYQSKTFINLSETTEQLSKMSLEKQKIYFQLNNQFFYVRNKYNQYLFKLINEKYSQIVMKNGVDIAYYQTKNEYVMIDQQQHVKDSQISLIYFTDYEGREPYFTKDIINIRKKSNDIHRENILTDVNGIVYDNVNDKLYQCSPGCQYCFHSKLCRKCSDSFYLFYYNKQCLRFTQNCKTCKQDQPNICLSCLSNYALVNNMCKKCHQTCLECSIISQNKCESCEFGKSLIVQSKKNKTCIQCSPNCLSCETENKCKQCDTGYVVNSYGYCISCPFNCNKCNSSALLHRLECKMGYYPEKSINSYENITCKRCSENCKLCKSQINCLQCQNLYRLKTINFTFENKNTSSDPVFIQKTICAARCVLPCKSCNQRNSTECLSCIDGYIYNKTTKQCIPDLTCNQFLNCTSCPHNYNLMINKCHLCQTDIKCNKCHQYNLSICLSCAKGYFLNDNQCFPCSNQCQECIIFDVCTKCTPGYILPLQSTASKCFPCSSNCKTCEYTPANCLSCKQNMQLHGSRCISNVSVNFNITLDYNYKSFSSADLEGISNQISLKTGKSRQKVVITSVKPGSVNLFGSILVQNQEDQTKVLKIVRTEFAQGSTINDKKITSSSYSGAFVEPLQVGNSSVNIKLILSIVIPVSVIIIAFIIFIVLKVRKLNRQLQEKNQTNEQSTQSGASLAMRQTRRKQRAAKKNKRNLPQIQKINFLSSTIQSRPVII